MRYLASLFPFVVRFVCFLLFGSLWLAQSHAQTEIYRSVAPDGTVTFSDDPPRGHQSVERVELPAVPAPPEPSSNPELPGYAEDWAFPSDPETDEQSPIAVEVSILSPADDQALRSDDGSVAVEVAVSPALRPGDVVEILLDGRAVARSETQVALLSGVDRGTHQLVARIVDAYGAEIATSFPVTMHLLRHSSAHPPPSNPAANLPPRER